MFFKTIFRVTVILSMVATKAAATVLPFWTNPRPDIPSRWSELSSSASTPQGHIGLNPDIVNLVNSHRPWHNYEEAIRVSYAMAGLREINELDELWAAVLIENHSSEALSTFLFIRGQINLPLAHGDPRSGYAKSYLWKVTSGSGDS
jgi:hypothetical protein